MFLGLLLQVPIIASLAIEDSVILISASTPADIKSFFPAEQMLSIQNLSFENAVKSLSEKNFLFLIDLTFKTSFTNFINSISSYFEAAYLSLFHYETTSKTRYEVHMSSDAEFELISSLVRFLGLDSLTVLSSSDQADSRLAEKFQTFANVRTFYYSDQITQKSAESLVLKMLKTQGLKYVILIDSSSSLHQIEKAIQLKKWDKPGVVLIRYSRSPGDAVILGSLQLAEEGTEGFKTISEYHYKSILAAVNRIDNQLSKAGQNNSSSRFQIIENLGKLSPQVVNLINFKPEGQIVGTFNLARPSLVLTSEIRYPGNTTSLSLSLRSTILLSIANGTHDPYYSNTYTYAAYLMSGATYAVARINKKQEIPNFDLKLNPTDCGLFWYDANWYKSCFSKLLSNFGIGFITSFFGESLKGNIFALRSLDTIVPHVSPLGTSVDTNNMTAYPELVKFEATPETFSLNRILTLMALGYRDMIVIGTKEPLGYYRYESFRNIIENNGMKIANDEDSRFVNWYYHRDNFTIYKDLFESIRRTRCTLVMIITYNHAMVLEALYDVGYRAGELLYVGDSGALSYLQGIPEPYLSKRRELITGGLIFSYREFVGTLGKAVKTELLQMFAEVTYMCMTFDTVSVFKEAILYLLTYGEDFEDYQHLMKTIRMNRFEGCLGTVFFSSNGNTRSSAQALIQQIYYNSSDDALRTIDIAFYDRFSSKLFNQINDFDWPTGEKPPNYIPKADCLADLKTKQESTEGKKILYYLSFGLFLTTLLAGLVSWFFNRTTIETLEEKAVISFEDLVCYFFFCMEFLQFIALGPDQEVYRVVMNRLNLLVSFDLDQYFSFEYDRFWQMFYSIFTVCIVWIFFAVAKIAKIGNFVPGSIQIRFRTVFHLFLYGVGHLLFLPCTSMIFNVFSCYQGTGDGLEDSYLKQDCRKHCYKDQHKEFAIASYIVLTFYLCLVANLRPKFQDFSSSLHIKTKPLFLVIETCLHVALVILNKTLKVENQTTHGIVFCLILSIFFGFTYFYSPYNFKRPLVCHCGFILASLWAVFTSAVFRGSEFAEYWIVVEMVGLGVIFFVVLWVFKKCPEMLYTEKGIEISNLFIFQFCRDYQKHLKSVEGLNFLSENKYAVEESSK